MFLFACCRERLIFSVSARDARLENSAPARGGSVLPQAHSAGWRAVTRVFHGLPLVVSWAASAAADLANVVFPSDCRLCGCPLLLLSQAPVCEACRSRVKPVEADALCSRCGDGLPPESLRFAAAMGMHECMMCRLAPPEFARAVAYAAYDDTAREMLHLLKFQGVAAVASTLLGEGMAQAMRKLAPNLAADSTLATLVVPVPLFAARARSRGYNQAQLLAEAGVDRLRRLCPEWRLELRSDLLRRVRDTRSSFTMAPHVRRENLRGAFRAVNAAALKGHEVLLVDDILTTGATARECARVLLRSGAVRVWVATYARTFSEDTTGGSLGVALWSKPVPATTSPT